MSDTFITFIFTFFNFYLTWFPVVNTSPPLDATIVYVSFPDIV